MTPPSLREVLTRALLSLLSGKPAATPPFPGWPALRGVLGGLAVALFFLWFHLSAWGADRGLFAIVGRIILGLLALLAFLSLIAWFEFAWAMHRREHQAALRISLWLCAGVVDAECWPAWVARSSHAEMLPPR